MNVLDKNEALHWFCDVCNAIAMKAIKTFPQEGHTAKDQSIENRLLSMEKQLGDVVSSINKLSVNSNLPTYSVATKTATASDHVPSDQFVLKIVDEYRDQEKCKLNLIFHKIPESSSTDTIKRREDDKKFVSNAVKEIGVDNPDIINTTRLGQINESKVRLLKVEFQNLPLKRSILSNAKKLCNASSEQLRKVYITPDLSYQERMHQKNLFSELQRHKDAGESDLIIRRGQLITAQRVAAEMDHSPSLLSSSAPVSSGDN